MDGSKRSGSVALSDALSWLRLSLSVAVSPAVKPLFPAEAADAIALSSADDISRNTSETLELLAFQTAAIVLDLEDAQGRGDAF
jgi:hypothetical protein